MTGFGRAEGENEDIKLSIDIRAVNHRYLDIIIKCPYYLKFAEEEIKKDIKGFVKRGRIEVFINAEKKNSGTINISADPILVKKYMETLDEIEEASGLRLEDRLKWILDQDDVIKLDYEKIDEEQTSAFILNELNKALADLQQMRKAEGEKTKEDLKLKLDFVEEKILLVEKRSPYVLEELEDRLLKKLAEILEPAHIDKDRTLQEICFYADKSDINEEIQRLRSHILQFKNTLDHGEAIGKKLDFLLQEMNREVNTMTSKSNDSELTNSIIEMKSIIEMMREQVQNIQ